MLCGAAEDCGGTGCTCDEVNTPSIVGLAVLLSIMKSTEELDERRRLPEVKEKKHELWFGLGFWVLDSEIQ